MLPMNAHKSLIPTTSSRASFNAAPSSPRTRSALAGKTIQAFMPPPAPRKVKGGACGCGGSCCTGSRPKAVQAMPQNPNQNPNQNPLADLMQRPKQWDEQKKRFKDYMPKVVAQKCKINPMHQSDSYLDVTLEFEKRLAEADNVFSKLPDGVMEASLYTTEILRNALEASMGCELGMPKACELFNKYQKPLESLQRAWKDARNKEELNNFVKNGKELGEDLSYVLDWAKFCRGMAVGAARDLMSYTIAYCEEEAMIAQKTNDLGDKLWSNEMNM